MALYVFDGTGNEDRDGDDRDSNACKFFNAYEDPNKNDDPKASAAASTSRASDRRAGRSSAEPSRKRSASAAISACVRRMDRLENNIEAGDTIVDIAGFSRGAALALSFANEIASKMKDLDVRFIGAVRRRRRIRSAGRARQRRAQPALPPNAHNVFHAMALDETRAALSADAAVGQRARDRRRPAGGLVPRRPLRRRRRQQQPELNGIALNWLFQNAIRHHVPIDPAAVTANLGDQGSSRAP